jgi:hypothetical protein
VGTFSSIFIASPILVFWQDFMAKRHPQAAAAPVAQASIEKPARPAGDGTNKKKIVRR